MARSNRNCGKSLCEETLFAREAISNRSREGAYRCIQVHPQFHLAQQRKERLDDKLEKTEQNRLRIMYAGLRLQLKPECSPYHWCLIPMWLTCSDVCACFYGDKEGAADLYTLAAHTVQMQMLCVWGTSCAASLLPLDIWRSLTRPHR
jgi:hypothetical protein